jgi:predicted acetyltransferase
MTEFSYGTATDADLDAMTRISALSFAFPHEDSRQWIERSGIGAMRVIRDPAGAVAGQLLRTRMGQFFGGRSVPMVGIAGVGVPPERRGTGVATTLMREALREIRHEGVPISTLYPATQPLYRRVGYEQAGSRFEVRLPIARIDVRDREMPVRPAEETDKPAIEACYRAAACHWEGWLDRGPYVWNRVWLPRGQVALGWVIDGVGGIEGYVVLQQARPNPSHARHDVTLTDICFTTPGAGRRLLGFLADFGSMGLDVVFHCGPTHPLLICTIEQRWTITFRDYWMLRIVDVAAALEARGYPAGLNAELTLDVEDELFEDNGGRYTLRVRDGRGSVARGGDGALRLDVGALAALYAGYLTPGALRQVGRLAGDGTTLRMAAGMFAGGSPGMPDMF